MAFVAFVFFVADAVGPYQRSLLDAAL